MHITFAVICVFCTCLHSEAEKIRRWQEIKIRQHRLLAEADHTQPAHIEQIMKSGFTMSDIKGWFSSGTFSNKLLLFTTLEACLNVSYTKEVEFHIVIRREKKFNMIGNIPLSQFYL
jgi:hypothetical protein